MKKSFTCFLFGALVSVSAFSQITSLHESFLNGIPKSFTRLNRDGMSIRTDDFAGRLPIESRWYSIDSIGVPDENYDYREPGLPEDIPSCRLAALSCSRRSDPAHATDNWLITPQIALSEGTILRWAAKSMHYDMAEDYQVLISETDTDPSSFKPIFACSEDYFWTRHAVDLSTYAGKSVYIAFVHTSLNKFILGLDDISIEVPEAPELKASLNGTRYFAEADDPAVSFTISNMGAPASVTAFEVRAYDEPENVLGSILFEDEPVAMTFNTEMAFSVPVELAPDQASRYRLYAKFADGSEALLFDDFVNHSTFRRKMFIQKFSGTWCNSCPKVSYTIHNLLHRLGSDAVYAEVHHPGVAYSDKDGYADYIMNVPLRINSDYPALWFNQRYEAQSFKPRDLTPFYNAAMMPCKASVTLTAYKAGGNHLAGTARVSFAEDMDNSDSHLRVGFIVVNTHTAPAEGSQEQSWQLPGMAPYHGEYYFMHSRVNNELTVLHNIIRAPGNGGTGAEGSLPAKIEAGKEYEVPFEFEYTPNINDTEVALISNIVDNSSRTLEVLNSDIATIAPEQTDGITLDTQFISLVEGETATLVANPLSPGARISWSLSHPEIASLTTSEATAYIKALAEGMTQIEAAADGSSAHALLKVEAPSSIEDISEASLVVTRLDEGTLQVILPEGLKAGSSLSVYDLQGRIIVKREISAHDGIAMRISIPENTSPFLLLKLSDGPARKMLLK